MTTRRTPRRSFNSQPPEGGCVIKTARKPTKKRFQLTAARRRLPRRPGKAAATRRFQLTAARRRLRRRPSSSPLQCRFNSQPLEGGCTAPTVDVTTCLVSTHSRSKAAAEIVRGTTLTPDVSTHSRSKAAAQLHHLANRTHARFNSQPLEGGCPYNALKPNQRKGVTFQLTAARRRLPCNNSPRPSPPACHVSTHSRSKAAAAGLYCMADVLGFQLTAARRRLRATSLRWWRCCRFQLTAARRRLQTAQDFYSQSNMFQLTAARRRLPQLYPCVCSRKQFQLTAARRRLPGLRAKYRK